jgi:hypothetical protein
MSLLQKLPFQMLENSWLEGGDLRNRCCIKSDVLDAKLDVEPLRGCVQQTRNSTAIDQLDDDLTTSELGKDVCVVNLIHNSLSLAYYYE